MLDCNGWSRAGISAETAIRCARVLRKSRMSRRIGMCCASDAGRMGQIAGFQRRLFALAPGGAGIYVCASAGACSSSSISLAIVTPSLQTIGVPCFF